MDILLDTHTFLWWLEGTGTPLSQTAHDLIADSNNRIFVSSATGWEISIKYGLGKLKLPDMPDIYVLDRIAKNGFIDLPISTKHSTIVHQLPAIHRDPFDRILVAQAQIEQLTLLTADPLVQQYPVSWLW
jgi:PIN domain nuclease of toxin-antitoxin system